MVEIGAIEVYNRTIHPDRIFHKYINPGRNIPEEVVRIHGISNADIKDEKPFVDIAGEFMQFIEGSVLVIHNAAFDLGFLMNELRMENAGNIDQMPVIDTLTMARERHPRQRNNLDALCDRYDVDRSRRTRHGALLDAELLAEMYLAMTGGRQFSLDTELHTQPASSFVKLPEISGSRDEQVETASIMRRILPPVEPQDLQAHDQFLERIHEESGHAIWRLPCAQNQ